VQRRLAEGAITIQVTSEAGGAAQDLLALNIDMASVMQAGRWKDTRMPMRYGEKVLAQRGGRRGRRRSRAVRTLEQM
jgi:hypothetical protein